MKKIAKLDYLWSDRKRVLGMPLSLTRYQLSEDRLFNSYGLLTVTEHEILLYRVQDLTVRISLGQRIFGVGTVIVTSSDPSQPILELKSVKHPRDVKELLHQQVEKMKALRGVRASELVGPQGGPHGARTRHTDLDGDGIPDPCGDPLCNLPHDPDPMG